MRKYDLSRIVLARNPDKKYRFDFAFINVYKQKLCFFSDKNFEEYEKNDKLIKWYKYKEEKLEIYNKKNLRRMMVYGDRFAYVPLTPDGLNLTIGLSPSESFLPALDIVKLRQASRLIDIQYDAVKEKFSTKPILQTPLKTQIVKLYSRRQSKYPDCELEVKIIEEPKKMLNEITIPKTFLAQKSTQVRAKKVELGELLATEPSVQIDGKIYALEKKVVIVTQEMVDAGKVKVEESRGGVLIFNQDEFEAKYKLAGGQDSWYIPQEKAKKFRIMTKDCALRNSNGELVIAPKGSYICVDDLDNISCITNVNFICNYENIRELKREQNLEK